LTCEQAYPEQFKAYQAHLKEVEEWKNDPVYQATMYVKSLTDKQLAAVFTAAEKEMVDRVLEHRSV